MISGNHLCCQDCYSCMSKRKNVMSGIIFFIFCHYCSAALEQRLNTSGLTFGSSLCLTGSSPRGLVSDHQPKWRPHCVIVPRQKPAPVGQDQGAHHPGGGAGDGEAEDGPDADDLTTFSFFVSLNHPLFRIDRSAKQSLRRAWPKETCLWWALGFQLPGLFLPMFEWYDFTLASLKQAMAETLVEAMGQTQVPVPVICCYYSAKLMLHKLCYVQISKHMELALSWQHLFTKTQPEFPVIGPDFLVPLK